MSRIVTPALLAAARSFGGRPAVSLDIADTRLHWSPLIAGAGSAHLGSDVVDDTNIHRMRTRGSVAEVARVTDPAVAAHWTTWTEIAWTVAADSDCAIARYAPNCLRAFFISAVGGGESIREKQSTDSGATWSAYTAVVTPAPGTHMLAAAHQRLFYATGTGIATVTKAGGSWSSPEPWASYAGHSALYGLAACYDGDGVYTLAVCYDGYLALASYNDSGGWGAPRQLIPGANGRPGASVAPRYPSIVALDGAWLVSYLDTCAGSPSWSQPTLFETDGHTVRNATALQLDAATHKRTALSHVAASRACYAANAEYVLLARRYAALDPTQHLGGLRVCGYQRRTGPRSGGLLARVYDPEGALKSFAQDGQPAAALRPLATAILRRGYMLGATPTTVALDPHYVTGISYQWGEGAGICTIEAADGWGLLSLWRPDTLLTWAGQRVIDLLGHLLGRVGLGVTSDGSDGANYVVPQFNVTPATSAFEAVQSLLALGGLAAYWQESGALRTVRLDTWAPPALGVGPAEIRTASLGRRVPEANCVRVYGQDSALTQVGAAWTDAAGAQRLGLTVVATRFDRRLTSAAQAELAALNEGEQAARDARHDQVEVPLRPDVELWDTVSLSTDATLVPGTDALRRVTGIEELYDAARGHYRSELLLTAR